MENKADCLFCGSPLIYFDTPRPMTCQTCGKVFTADVSCEKGHYVCDRCHALDALDMITERCLSADTTDPLTLAIELMHDPRVKMHGPEHHYLVPAVLLTAYAAASGKKEGLSVWLGKARGRAEKVPGGFCGSHGDCGAGVGTGIFISIITGSTPVAEKEWQLSNRMTACSLLAIADHGGPRCCKRDSYLAIQQAVEMVKKEFSVQLQLPDRIHCGFSDLNRECKREGCVFFG